MGSPLHVAFEHHGWANVRVLDVCGTLAPEQLAYHMTGTYGSILATMVHVIESDGFYLAALGVIPEFDPLEPTNFAAMRERIELQTGAWRRYLESEPDPDAIVTDAVGDVQYRNVASVGVRLAQALHHGSDHRSQICSALSALRLVVPEIDVWEYAAATGAGEGDGR